MRRSGSINQLLQRPTLIFLKSVYSTKEPKGQGDNICQQLPRINR